MTERKYLPTFADLIDRLSISLMKSIFIDRETYRAEMKLILEDLDGQRMMHTQLVYAILALMLANRYIWENEGAIRAGDKQQTGHGENYLRLRATHSVNGVRNRAKNEISKIFGERVDQKIDCLAADLPGDLGNWNIFDPD